MKESTRNRIAKNDKKIEALRSELNDLYVENYQLVKEDRENEHIQ